MLWSWVHLGLYDFMDFHLQFVSVLRSMYLYLYQYTAGPILVLTQWVRERRALLRAGLNVL